MKTEKKSKECNVTELITHQDKPIILTFIGNYLPGYKAGGILRTTINTVDHLCDEFDFMIVTRDRDLGDSVPYPDVKIEKWQKVGNSMVYYLSPKSCSIRALKNLILSTDHHVLYLNSFFDTLTIKILFSRMIRKQGLKSVIVAPWGEFGWASLKQKYFKKIVFIQASKLFGLYKNVVWRASSEIEKMEIMKYMNSKPETILVTGDFPIKSNPSVTESGNLNLPKPDDSLLRIVFLSRISREKNLDYALKVLSKLKANVIFDIYGPAENLPYWNECQKIIENMPHNVRVNYLGSVKSNQVVTIFSRYDLFFFPTGGEAYGHVIAECLMAGTPVLISTETPWRNLEEDGFGWDVDLSKMNSFIEIIEKLALTEKKDLLNRRIKIKENIMLRLLDPAVLEANRQLFHKQIE